MLTMGKDLSFPQLQELYAIVEMDNDFERASNEMSLIEMERNKAK